MKINALSALAAFVTTAALASSASAGDAFTTRIEPRPYYGATITLEHGVRVYRPLPATKHVIINPNQTPLNLSYTDVTERSESHNYIYDRAGAGTGAPAYGYAGGIGFPDGVKTKPARKAVPRPLAR